jgi:hypothetical protein
MRRAVITLARIATFDAKKFGPVIPAQLPSDVGVAPPRKKSAADSRY